MVVLSPAPAWLRWPPATLRGKGHQQPPPTEQELTSSCGEGCCAQEEAGGGPGRLQSPAAPQRAEGRRQPRPPFRASSLGARDQVPGLCQARGCLCAQLTPCICLRSGQGLSASSGGRRLTPSPAPSFSKRGLSPRAQPQSPSMASVPKCVLSLGAWPQSLVSAFPP